MAEMYSTHIPTRTQFRAGNPSHRQETECRWHMKSHNSPFLSFFRLLVDIFISRHCRTLLHLDNVPFPLCTDLGIMAKIGYGAFLILAFQHILSLRPRLPRTSILQWPDMVLKVLSLLLNTGPYIYLRLLPRRTALPIFTPPACRGSRSFPAALDI